MNNILESKKRHLVWMDILNIVSCFAVIVIHHNDLVHKFSRTTEWKQALLLQTVSYWAVPIFLMLSGATLLTYREKYSTKEFFIKRIKRVVIPFIIWSIIMIIWMDSEELYVIKDPNWKKYVSVLLNNKMLARYWYFPVQISIYMIMPLLSLVAKPQYKKVLWYCVGMLFFTVSVIPYVCKVVGISWNTALQFPINKYLIFILLGYLISRTDFNKKQRLGIYFLGFCGMFFKALLSGKLSMKNNHYDTTFTGYCSFLSVFMAVAVFVLIKNIDWDRILKSIKARKVISQISGCSLGIYLIHSIVMYYEQENWNLTIVDYSWRVYYPIVTYIICLAIVFVIRKIPIVKKLIP